MEIFGIPIQAFLGQLLAGTQWAPHNDLFGFAPFIAGSVAVIASNAVKPSMIQCVYQASRAA